MDSNSLTRGLPTHLTLFYSKKTGAIKKYTTGITDLFKAFGKADGEELSLIYDTIIIDYDEQIANDYSNYVVIDGIVKKANDPLTAVAENIEEVKASNVESLSYIFDLDFRVLELEYAFNLPMAISTSSGVLKDMNVYKIAKTLILAGEYEREDMEYKLSVHLKRNRITRDEYDELVALMDARELVK